MVIVKEEASYKNFGKCLSISNGALEVLITVDVGPRIIKCALTGKHNLMFEDIERKLTHDVSALFGEGKTWNIYGGHRLWLSPESFPETYYPDNEKVVYTIRPDGAEFTPAKQDNTGLQYTITVTMDPVLPELNVNHIIKNTKSSPVKGAAWALTVLDRNGAVIVPQPKEDTGLLPNRVLAVWPYTDLTDKRLFLGKEYIALRQNPEVKEPIKFGINNTVGKVAYINYGQALVKETEFIPDSVYPDFGVSSEIYSCDMFTEAETLSPLREIKPGDFITHTERWRLIDNVDIGEFSNDSLASVAEQLF